MNIRQLKQSNYIIFECITGSHAYNLNIETSDIDKRGIFKLSKDQYLSIISLPQEVSDEKQDYKFYELTKFINLAMGCNPNLLELLFAPKDTIIFKNEKMDHLINNRNLFISQKAFFTFSGYSFAQIKKAKGQNKLVHNPEQIDPPKKEDFCWFIPDKDYSKDMSFSKGLYFKNLKDSSMLLKSPCRPIPLKQLKIDLSEYHVAALEHVSNTYRLYFYGAKSKGVFRGNSMLVTESIPLEDEWKRYCGLLIYNEQEYEKALCRWKQYWEWVKNRNKSRWVDQENKKINYDAKNLMHCMRLLYSGKNILLTGEPIIRFEGEQREYLMNIRNGEFEYEKIMKEVEKEMKIFEELKTKTKLQHHSNIDKIDKLYKELINQ